MSSSIFIWAALGIVLGLVYGSYYKGRGDPSPEKVEYWKNIGKKNRTEENETMNADEFSEFARTRLNEVAERMAAIRRRAEVNQIMEDKLAEEEKQEASAKKKRRRKLNIERGKGE